MKFSLGMALLVATLSPCHAAELGASSEWPTLRIRLHLKDGVSVADVNRELSRQGVRGRLPEVASVSLASSASELHDDFWNLFDLARKADAELDAKQSIQDACFMGSNVAVAKAFEKLNDGWLNDQVQLIRKTTPNRDSVRILYSEGDGGTDRRWLNFDRCR